MAKELSISTRLSLANSRRRPVAALLLLEMSASLQELHPNARPTPAPEMNHARQPYFSNYSFFFFLFFFFMKKITQNSPTNKIPKET